jgi:hypothetical protein
MANDTNALREHYSTLSDDALQNIAIEGGLTDQARELLSQELGRRGIQDVSGYQEHLDRFDQDAREKKQRALERRERRILFEQRMGYSLALLVFVGGLYVRLVQHDQRNGVGIMIASAVLFPLVWIMARIRRLIWRVLLRP